MFAKQGLILLAASAILTLSGCASVQPRTYTKTSLNPLPWKTYEEAENAFKKIEWGKTTFEDLKKLGFDPEKIPNTAKSLTSKGISCLVQTRPCRTLKKAHWYATG